jgi:hypothetical protein
VSSLAVRHGLDVVSTSGGEDERYAVLRFTAGPQRYEVYIYDDEIGIDRSGLWEAFESQDFDSDECLLSRALEVLEVHLGRDQG